jgi:ligand-binding sensor domain-containing protein
VPFVLISLPARMRIPITILAFVCVALCSSAQQNAINFHKLSPQDGLHDGTVRSITQDKHGYLWIGTVGALNRFDGKNFKHYTNIPGDSSSPYAGQPRSIHTDKKGNLWIGYEMGLQQYVYAPSSFKSIAALKEHYVFFITSYADSLLLLGTTRGFIKYNRITGKAFNYTQSTLPQFALLYQNNVNECSIKGNTVYLATNKGLLKMDLLTNEIIAIPVPLLNNVALRRIAVDKNNNIWLGTYGAVQLVKLHNDFKTTEVFDRYLSSSFLTNSTNIYGIICDSKNRIWVITSIDGLLQYDEAGNKFIKHLHDDNFSTSPSVNFYRSIFEDKDGTIWLGCDSYGVNYFEPDKNFFQTILPFRDSLNVRQRAVSRAVTEDKEGNLWMGTHDGVSRYNFKTGTYTVWHNEAGKKQMLYTNVVRSILCDDENNVWIGTGAGVNRYNNSTKTMEFIPQQNLPLSFYNSITKDRSGNVWFCTNDSATVYWYAPAQKKFDNITHHPQLKKYSRMTPTSYVMEDSKQRLWISFARKGVVMWDKKTGLTKQYTSGADKNKNIGGNAIIDIKEDKKGVIWVSSYNGISGIDVERDTIISYNNKNGLQSNWVCALAVDDQNRLWMGVHGGLTMLEDDRKTFTTFTQTDGLPSAGFTEHAGIRLRSGEIIFPSNNGFILFNPAQYKAKPVKVPFYIGRYSVFDKEYNGINEEEQNPVLHLKAHENSFTFELTALNYLYPEKTWFAYKLEGFDDNWRYTQDPKAVYTNVPGGDYRFVYKAAVFNTGWGQIKEKQLYIKLQTVFYRTWWFAVLLIAITSLALFLLYRYRITQKENVMMLQGKAQLLEKEKAMVMYEGLKQQLNPHFLFNSLTSLSGLIETKPAVAVEFLEQMSGIYRYILKNDNTEKVALKDEIESAQLYINLQQTRFKKGLQVLIDVPEEFLHYKIAPVTLQNLIENAIKHNIIDIASPLVIRILIEDGYIVVKNNLQKKTNVETSNKKGLAQFITLYSYLSRLPVFIEETQHDFIIKIPLI